MSFTDEQNWFEMQSHLRGFKQVKAAKRLSLGEVVCIKNKRYKVTFKHGKHVLEPIAVGGKGII